MKQDLLAIAISYFHKNLLHCTVVIMVDPSGSIDRCAWVTAFVRARYSRMREFVLVSIAAVAAAYALSTDLIVDVDTEPRHRMDRLSSSFSIDSTSLFGYTRQGIDLTDSSLVQLAKNLAPAYIRIGGGIQDQVVYNTSGQIPAGGLPPRPAGIHLLYMNATVWDSLIDLCDRAGLRLVFGLNAKYGRQAKGDVPANEAPDWDPSNTR